MSGGSCCSCSGEQEATRRTTTGGFGGPDVGRPQDGSGEWREA
jgi:hypothetical protein